MRARRRALRRLPHGRVRGRGARRARRAPAPHHQRRGGARVGQVQYSVLCYPRRRHRRRPHASTASAADRYMLVVNASQHRQGLGVGHRARRRRAALDERVATRPALLAVQGPKAEALVGRLADARRDARSATTASRAGTVAGVPALISRTGYTGEDGFELYVAGRRDRAAVGRAARGGPRRRRRADRPRRARHAAARDALRALRQRHRRDHQPARGRARLGGQAGQGRLHRARGDRGACARAGSPRKLVGFEMAERAVRAPRLSGRQGRRARSAWSRRARTARRSSAPSAWPTSPTAARRRRHRARRGDPRPGASAARVVQDAVPSVAASRKARATSMANVPGGSQVHARARVGQAARATASASASPPSPRSSSATSSSSSCPRSAPR